MMYVKLITPTAKLNFNGKVMWQTQGQTQGQ